MRANETYSEAKRHFSARNRDVLIYAQSPHKWWSTLKPALFGLSYSLPPLADNAIGHVLYIRSVSQDHQVHVSFISSSSKVAPRCATSTPRLELCAAVEATRSVRATTMELERKPDDIYLYSDSKVVLGYLINEQRRFTKYVTRRVAMVLKHVPIDNWCYIATDQNPADYASRPNTPTALMSSFWYKGPEFLWSPEYKPITYK